MLNFLIISLSKLISKISKNLNLGHGSTWPGHIALNFNKNFIKDILELNPGLKVILVAGTNGKTTTSKIIRDILENQSQKVFQNESGANLLNGIASSMILNISFSGHISFKYAIFEIDENTLPLILKKITPDYLILLNLFRDQLDRYGEVNTIADKWKKSINTLNKKTTLIANADDPQIFHITKNSKAKTSYFGLSDKSFSIKKKQHAVDSIFCPICYSRLNYKYSYYSHLGIWNCNKCLYKRPNKVFSEIPDSQLSGVYNLYNLLAAFLFSKKIKLSQKTLKRSILKFEPAFGRQEVIYFNDKKIQLFLSKNPISFNESLRTIEKKGADNVMFVLNDRIPDGRDVSWIWDVDFEEYIDNFKTITTAGDRCYDMALRIKYTDFNINKNKNLIIETSLKKAILNATNQLTKKDTLYILPTYSAMLETRKIITGRSLL